MWHDIVSAQDDSNDELLSDLEPESKASARKRRIEESSEDPEDEESDSASLSQNGQHARLIKRRKLSGEKP